MHIASFLTRPCLSNLSDREIKQCSSVELYVEPAISDDLMYEVQEDELLDALKVRRFVKNEWTKTNEGMGEEKRRSFVVQDSITCYSDFIPVNDRFYVPHSIRPSYLQQCSQGHQGIFKCKNKAPKSAKPRHIKTRTPASHTSSLMRLNPQTNPILKMRFFPAPSVSPWRHTRPLKLFQKKQKKLKKYFQPEASILLKKSMSNSRCFAKRSQTSR